MGTVMVISPARISFDKERKKPQTGEGLRFNPHDPESAERRAERLYSTDITNVTSVTATTSIRYDSLRR